MKLLTAEGFSLTLQVTSLILLVGYSVSKSKNDLPRSNKPKTSEIYPSYIKIKNQMMLYDSPNIPIETPKKTAEILKKTSPIC